MDQPSQRGSLTIKDDSVITHTIRYTDGTSYVVEIGQGRRYRTYMVANPDVQSSTRQPSRSAMLQVAAILETAFE